MVKSKKRGKNTKNKGKPVAKRELVFKEHMQEYALITKILGDRRLRVTLPDKSVKMAIIPGRFRRRCWMRQGDIILISYRDFQANKLDVIFKYKGDEAKMLVNYGELPSFFLDSVGAEEEEASGISFGYEKEDEDFDFSSI